VQSQRTERRREGDEGERVGWKGRYEEGSNRRMEANKKEGRRD
jgi:hypothetical protein